MWLSDVSLSCLLPNTRGQWRGLNWKGLSAIRLEYQPSVLASDRKMRTDTEDREMEIEEKEKQKK
jgi:hypothetical protein